jgi:lactoylglutathione lyase
MKYLHTMVRVSDVAASLNFYCNLLGLTEVRRSDIPCPARARRRPG